MDSLISAVRDGNLVKVRALIQEGADVNEKNNNGFTSLHYCALHGHTDILKILVSSGADVKAKLKNGWTDLNTSHGLYKGLQRYAEVKAKEEDEWTALHFSVRHDHIDVVQVLISNGAVVDEQDKYGITPLHISADSGQRDILRALISAGASVNVKAVNGYNPLHCSVVSGYLGIAKELIFAGADASRESEKGRTFFDLLQSRRDPSYETVIKYTLLYQSKPSLKKELEYSNDALRQVWMNCEKHVESMRETSLGGSCISFYDFIKENCENKLAVYTTQENFGLKSDSERSLYIEKFSMYASDIRAQFKKGSKRAYLLQKSIELLMFCFYPNLPPELIKKICEYLTNADMQHFFERE